MSENKSSCSSASNRPTESNKQDQDAGAERRTTREAIPWGDPTAAEGGGEGHSEGGPVGSSGRTSQNPQEEVDPIPRRRAKWGGDQYCAFNAAKNVAYAEARRHRNAHLMVEYPC